MKIISKVWIVLSVILIAFLILRLSDAYVSLKYEVEEVELITDAIKAKEESIRYQIATLWIFIVYVGVSMILSLLYILKEN